MAGQTPEELFGHRFKNPELLREALTHKSYAFEKGGCRDNERLEFLGDSVLAGIVAHFLYERHPDEDEGSLSKKKAALVSRAALARWAEELGLGRHMRLGQGEESTGGRDRPSIVSNALEAVIGAIYLDGGFEPARRFIRDRLLRQGPGVEADHKSRLQEVVQKRSKALPEYRMNKTSGPDHDRTFSVTVQVGAKMLGSGKGKNKKEAEQAAAKDALARMPL